MIEPNAFERRLAAGLEAIAGPPRTIDAMAIARTAASGTPATGSIFSRLHWSTRPVRTGRRSAEGRLVLWLIAASLVAIALVAGALASGGRLLSSVSPSPQAPTASPLQTSGPASGLIAYSSDGQIFVAAPDGTNRRALTPADGNAYRPRWAPDGERIAFLSMTCTIGRPCDTKASPTSLVVVKADGSQRQVLEENLRGVQTLEWSPDGKRLAFDAESPFGVRVVAIDTHEVRAVGVGQSPSWSPDGTTLAYEGDEGTHLVAADGTGERLLLQPTAAGWAIGGRWSPDGSQLAFIWKQPCCPPANRGSDEWVVDRSGNFPHRMSEVPDGATFGGWSPDGLYILYLATSDPSAGATLPLVVANSDGSNPRPIATGDWELDGWSPDGTRVFLIRHQVGSTIRLVISDPTGAVTQMEVPAEDATWQPIP